LFIYLKNCGPAVLLFLFACTHPAYGNKSISICPAKSECSDHIFYRKQSKLLIFRSARLPKGHSACVVTHRSSGVFVDVRRGSETPENGIKAAVYAAPANNGGTGRTRGAGVRILSPRPPHLKSRFFRIIRLQAWAAKKPPLCVVACVVTQNLLRRRAIGRPRREDELTANTSSMAVSWESVGFRWLTHPSKCCDFSYLRAIHLDYNRSKIRLF